MKRLLSASLALGLAACGAVGTPPPADPKVTAEIVNVCMGSGLFVAINSTLTSLVPVPGVAIAGSLVDAGVMQVCADPARFARDASTVIWLVKLLAAAIKSHQ